MGSRPPVDQLTAAVSFSVQGSTREEAEEDVDAVGKVSQEERAESPASSSVAAALFAQAPAEVSQEDPPVSPASSSSVAAALEPAPADRRVFRTLVVTHVECANHITPALSGKEYMAGSCEEGEGAGEEKAPAAPAVNLASPEQPERVTAVFAALKRVSWSAGGTSLVEALELTTSPTLSSALDSGVKDWAKPEEEGDRKRARKGRTTSVSYLFDDVEPIVLRVHDFDYLSRIAAAVEKMQDDEKGGAGKKKPKLELCRCVSLTMTGDTFASARSLHAALCASFACCRAVDSVVRGDYRNAFCVVRPPGHHAGARGSTRGESGELVGQGFCLINHAAVATRYALTNHSHIVRRVAVIDWDLHHGNGTEDIFCADDGPLARDSLREAVLFCSIHGSTPVEEQHDPLKPKEPPLFPGTALHSTPAAERDVPGRAFNVAVPKGTSPTDFIERFRELVDAAGRFKPDLIIVSAGFDAHKDDLFRFLKLTDRTFKIMTEMVVDLAARCCEGRLVSILEGGYHVPTLVRAATVHVKALATHRQPLPVVSNNSVSPPRSASPADPLSPSEILRRATPSSSATSRQSRQRRPPRTFGED